MHWIFLALAFGIFASTTEFVPPVYITQTGSVDFTSDAPLELIKASSTRLQGAFDVNKRTFAFRIPMNSFEGFNDPLQREHFCEKFLECGKFPNAIFQGKLIENQDFTRPGTYEIRAKGTLSMHGIETERILPVTLEVTHEHVRAISAFTIKLADHDIRIPQVVFHKIAQEIYVKVDADLKPRDTE